MLDVLNKIDQAKSVPVLPGAVAISAKEGMGIDALLHQIGKRIFPSQRTVTLLIPYAKGALLNELHENATVLQESYEEQGTRVQVRLDQARLDKLLADLGPAALEAVAEQSS